ncbi:MobF family relaxase [Isoptericola sp. NPDC019482]|uniref:MobF family relaxase n=1 Tax=Isoptericola sp. NPDC019482 TaxID=3154688 RepID=UPI003492CE67
MTVSLKVMHVGSGVEYFLQSVVVGDGNRPSATPLTRYYTEAGTPPGRWLGSGLDHLGGDGARVRAGDVVTEDQLVRLIERGQDPVTGEKLGKAFYSFASGKDVHGKSRGAVSGYDLTFSLPKSASVLWGLADAGIQAAIWEAHHAAVADVVAFFERGVAATRVGAATKSGAVAQVGVIGIVAAAYDHFDSRAADPHLHTHVVVSSKARAVLDGSWRALDGRPIHAATVALSELHQGLVADRLTAVLGVGWEERSRGPGRNPSWDLTAVPDQLVRLFSARAREIDEAKDELVAEWTASHGRSPSAKVVLGLRQHATLATRPAKKRDQSLDDLTSQWQQRASRVLDRDATEWANAQVRAARRHPWSATAYRAKDVPADAVDALAAHVLAVVSEKRSTWRHWNLYAEVSRQLMAWRFATTEDREGVAALIVATAERESERLTPVESTTTPARFLRPDGTSVFRPKDSVVYSSTAILEAEARLLALAEDTGGPRVSPDRVDLCVGALIEAGRLSRSQATAVSVVATSGRVVDVLAGPAGAGKTTAMRGLAAAWRAEHGRSSVVGLAPSAVAAQVLSDDLGRGCENTAKWIWEHERGRAQLHRGQLVIVDEASLASTPSLDSICRAAALAGAKVLLVGDAAQLQSVGAGGAFGMLLVARPGAPELLDVHRFRNEWEGPASLRLRSGDTDVIDRYLDHQRVVGGNLEQMVEAAYQAWSCDLTDGKASILVAESGETVSALNERARTQRQIDGHVAVGREVTLADGTYASSGDWVITRRNDRHLQTRNGGWVANGNRWMVTAVHRDGALTVRPAGSARGNAVVLPAQYVSQHVDLGYAVTTYRAQGITVDTAHVVVTAATTRENLYVSMTRGRDANRAYVALDQHDEAHVAPRVAETTAQSVLYGVVNHSGTELSARQTIEAERERWGSISQLAAEYETIAADAQRPRWEALVRDHSGLKAEQVADVIASPAFGPLTATLRRLEAEGRDVGVELPHAIECHGLIDADDVAAVVNHRLTRRRAENAPTPRRGMVTQEHARSTTHFICGLTPEALGPMDPEMRTALDDRKKAIEHRALDVAQRAVRNGEEWIEAFPPCPEKRWERTRWVAAVVATAAYRDRYANSDTGNWGSEPLTRSQQRDRVRVLRTVAGVRARAERRSHAEGLDALHGERERELSLDVIRRPGLEL